MAEKYDLIVIGSGAAGGTTAAACSRAGWKVAIIDSEPYGGTCANRGCMPKKVLFGAAETVDTHNRLAGKGLPNVNYETDWPRLMRFKGTFTDSVPEKTIKSYEDAGITTYAGRARFIAKDEIRVANRILKGNHFLIAAGAKPFPIDIPGQEFITFSDKFLELENLPRKIVFIGGGFISFELAHSARRGGAEVEIIDRGDTPLKPFDPDLVAMMINATKKAGIGFETNRPVSSIEKSTGGLIVNSTTPSGESRRFKADLVVHGAGRVPDIDDMNLDAAGVDRSRRGVVVNEFLQSVSNDKIYAAGDSAEIGPPLTPVAVYQGRKAAENLLRGNTAKVDHRVVPSIVFTIPTVSGVGLLESQARESGLNFRVNHADTTLWFTARHLQEQAAGHKVLIEEDSDQILGAHFVGAAAAELVNVFALAMRNNTTATELSKTLFAYPTAASDIAYML